MYFNFPYHERNKYLNMPLKKNKVCPLCQKEYSTYANVRKHLLEGRSVCRHKYKVMSAEDPEKKEIEYFLNQ